MLTSNNVLPSMAKVIVIVAAAAVAVVVVVVVFVRGGCGADDE